MDNSKENGNYKGLEKDKKNNQQVSYNNRSLRVILREQDNELSFIIEKTEKLTTALYMITDFFNEKEPLKWEIRKGAVSLLSFMHIPAQTMISWENHNILSAITEIITLLELSCCLHLISEMNLSILKTLL